MAGLADFLGVVNTVVIHMHKLFVFTLIVVLVYLQSRLWFGEGSIAEMVSLRDTIEKQQLQSDRLHQRNKVLASEVIELQNGLETIESEARQELGLIRHDETFYLIYD